MVERGLLPDLSPLLWLHLVEWNARGNYLTLSHFMRLDGTSHRGGKVQLKDAESIVVLEACAGISDLEALLLEHLGEFEPVSADASC